jgi:hypothetical protein
MIKKIIFLACVAAIVIAVNSCEYHDTSDLITSTTTDEILFEVINESGYQYYQNGNTLSPASASPHGAFKLRFNAIAWSSLDKTGELPEDGRFPEGSVVVKEVFIGNDLTIYAVLKKATSDANARSGWLWAEYSKDGSTAFSVTRKGNGCTSCHSESGNRDLVRTFDLH